MKLFPGLLIVIFVACKPAVKPAVSAATYRKETRAFMLAIRKDALIREGYVLQDATTFGAINFQECLDAFLADRFFSWNDKRAIAQAGRNPDLKQWDNELFSGIKIMRREDISAYFHTGSSGWQNFNQRIGPGYFLYSAPVFFRNYTYCLIYSAVKSNEGGEGAFLLYRRSGNIWICHKECGRWKS